MPKFDPKRGVVKFDNEQQSKLFLEFLENTKITDMRGNVGINQSLENFFLKSQNRNTFILKTRLGASSLVSKFMEVTEMFAMDYKKYMEDSYVPNKEANKFPLGRQGEATIDSSVLKKMQRWSSDRVIEIIKELKADLDEKCKKENLLDKKPEGILSPKQDKLLKRQEAISALYEEVKDKISLSEDDKLMAKKALEICLHNKPGLSEKTFLESLAQILNFVLKPFSRGIFFKEERLQNELEQKLPSPKI